MFSLTNLSYFTASWLCFSPPCFSLLLPFISWCASGALLLLFCQIFLFSTVPYIFLILPLCSFTISEAFSPVTSFLFLFSFCSFLNFLLSPVFLLYSLGWHSSVARRNCKCCEDHVTLETWHTKVIMMKLWRTSISAIIKRNKVALYICIQRYFSNWNKFGNFYQVANHKELFQN